LEQPSPRLAYVVFQLIDPIDACQSKNSLRLKLSLARFVSSRNNIELPVNNCLKKIPMSTRRL
jgi:hypothetical protein